MFNFSRALLAHLLRELSVPRTLYDNGISRFLDLLINLFTIHLSPKLSLQKDSHRIQGPEDAGLPAPGRNTTYAASKEPSRSPNPSVTAAQQVQPQRSLTSHSGTGCCGGCRSGTCCCTLFSASHKFNLGRERHRRKGSRLKSSVNIQSLCLNPRHFSALLRAA